MAFERMTQNVLNVSALPNAVTGQASSLKATFDEAGSDLKTFINNFLTVLESAIAASNIGAMNGELESNVQAVIDTFLAAIADRYTKSEIDSKVAGDTNDLIKDLAIDLNTGIFTITKKDGTTQTIDTTLEKVPTNFAFVEENGTYYLRVTNTDGTSTQVDVTELFNDYTFNNTDTVAFTTTKDGNKATITAEIRDASIGLEKLSLTAISQIEGYAASASAAAQTATQKASEAKTSADNALASANTAVSAANSAVGIEASALNSANSASTSASNSATYATESSTQATLSRSWAVGGTGSRTGEDTNNAKYWAEVAQGSASGGDMMKSVYDTNGDGVVDKADNGIIILEASTDNIVDFNTLTEPGIYLIKNCISSGENTNVANFTHVTVLKNTCLLFVWTYDSVVTQNMYNGVGQIAYTRSRNSLGVWPTWTRKITADTTAMAALTDFQVRNIIAQTTDLTAGTSALTTGNIVLIYE